ncbi:MAG: winged helix DNA-binding domain-containing protein [Gemmatimonadales bacterium]
MTPAQLPSHRLHSQRLAASTLTNPADVVRWLGAVQAQEYLGGLWAIGLRTRHATETTVERAIADRSIVRTWPMRGTLHFVPGEDARWMLELLAPRVAAAAAGWLERDYGLDRKAFRRCAEVVARALEGGRRLTREGMYRVLDASRIRTAAGRHIIWGLAHSGLICFGPREGKEHTLVLLDEWVPRARRLAREEALAELARRYFTSHGPATAHDFAWWSGLLLRDVAEAIALAGGHLASVDLAGRTYWASSSARDGKMPSRCALLLPPFDEFSVAYRDRSALLSPPHATRARGLDLLRPTIVVNGRIVGFWSRRRGGQSSVNLDPFTRLGDSARRAVAAAARRYCAFVGPAGDAC